MSNLASEVRKSEEDSTVRRIPTGAQLVLGAALVTERGPFAATTCSDFNEFKKVFGGYTANNLAFVGAVQSYFDNGGTDLTVARCVHCSDPTDPTTKTSALATCTLQTGALAAGPAVVTGTITAPYLLTAGDTLLISIDGGGDLTATFTATAATRTAGGSATYALTNGMILTLQVDGGGTQTVTFLTASFAAIGAATTAEVNAVINAQITGASADASGGKPRITSDKLGTNSGINITGGTANAIFTFPTGLTSGTGNVANIAAVTNAEFKTIVEAAVAGTLCTNVGGAPRIATTTTGSGHSIQVKTASTAEAKFGLDTTLHTGTNVGAQNTLTVNSKTDGAYGNSLRPVISASTDGVVDHFKLTILRNGVRAEAWDNLTMDTTSPNYVATVVNDQLSGSDLIAVVDLFCSAGVGSSYPAAGTFGPLTGGSDGLVGLTDTDFVGGSGVNGDVGFRLLDAEDIDVLIAPGRATPTIHNAMVTYVEITRAGLCFAVLDPPANQSAVQMVTYVKSTASLYNLSEYCAMYWPQIKVANPNKTIFGNAALVTIPPSGMVVGVYSRVDAQKVGGVFDHPAGTDPLYLPRNVLDVEMSEVKKKSKRDLVFPALINPISKEKNTPIFIDGARCMRDNGPWPTIGERRGIIFVEKSLIPGLAFMRHRKINDTLYRRGADSCNEFLGDLCREGAFRYKDPKKAFFVDFGAGLNSAAVQKGREVVARLGIATSPPAEFITLLISPDTRALDEELAALAA